MQIANFKLTIDLETHPDQISLDQFAHIEALPGFDEIDTYSDTTFVMFWFEGRPTDQIEPTLASLREIMEILL